MDTLIDLKLEHPHLKRTLFIAAAFATALSGGMGLAQSPPASPSPPVTAIEPEAVQAIQRMRAYLGTLTTFEVRADNTQDVVLVTGQKVQIDGVATYRVRRPDGFEVKVTTGNKVRDFYYDGKQLTVYAPQLGFYAQTAAPPTIAQTLEAAYDRYGIVFPLEELFHWSQPGDRLFDVTSAIVIGDALIDGANTTQYAFRRGHLDWSVWIEKGDRPVPRKILIVDHADEARPAYSVRLSWSANPRFSESAFSFRPGKEDKPIQILAAR